MDSEHTIPHKDYFYYTSMMLFLLIVIWKGAHSSKLLFQWRKSDRFGTTWG